MMETQAATRHCLEPFRWESLRRWDFRPQLIFVSGLFWWESLRGWDFRPQLIVVSGLSGGNPFVDGILDHNLLLSRAFLHDFVFFPGGIPAIKKPFSRTVLFFHDGILAITEPYSRTFSFFTMEFWLSRSLSHELFSFLTMEYSGYHEAFLMNFFFFHDVILAITKPFSRTFSFFTMEL
jgi:hypothetical protein